MSTVKFVKALVKVTSNHSGGRAAIIRTDDPIISNPSKWSKPDHLTSAKFKTPTVGSYMIVEIRVSDSTRSVKKVVKQFEYSLRMWEAVREWEEMIKNIEIPWGGKVEDHLEKEVPVEQPIAITKSDIHIGDEDLKLFRSIKNLSGNMHPAVLMIGPSGYGKTSIPERLAEDWDMRFVRWDCSTIRDPEEFFGYRAAIDGSTADAEGEQFFFETEFTEAIQTGNTIVVLDELNRIDPYISNALFPLIDHAGETTVLGHNIKVGENVIFFATINVGHQFTGTFTLDSALSNRFMAKVLVGALPNGVESNLLVKRTGINKSMANKIVKIVSKLRDLNKKEELDVDASTRVSLQIANLVIGGLDIRSALTYTIINGSSREESKTIADAVGIV